MSNLKSQIKEFPKTSGVYQFIDEGGKVLYIGKAKNLQSRIKSYFLSAVGRGPSIDIMVAEAKDIKYIETESEIEAVILEADLINKISPKYNIRQKDDKSFLVIKITKSKKFDSLNKGGTVPFRGDSPQVSLVRYRDVDFADKSAEYFGPYPSGDLLKRSLRYLRKIIPFRDCTAPKYNSHSKKQKRCLFGDLGLCEAPCVDDHTPSGSPFLRGRTEYQKNIKMLKELLRGKKQSVYRALQKEMKNLSHEKRYEEAKIYRDRLNALEHIKDVAIGLSDDIVKPENILFKRIECFDISNISGQYCVGSMVVFIDSKPDKSEYRKFRIRYNVSGIMDELEVRQGSKNYNTKYLMPNTKETNGGDLAMMEQVLKRRFNNDWPLPNLVIIDGGLVHLNLTRKIIAERKLDIPVVSIAKGPKRQKNEFHFSNQILAQYFHKNLDLQRIAIKARNEAHRFAIGYYRKLHRKDMLNVT